MRKPYLLFLAAFALMTPPGAQAANMPWVKSLDAAMDEAKRTDKLVMIDFYTDWCGWCKRLDAVVYTDASVIQAAQQVIPVRINAEKEGLAAARHYGVTGFPTILFINKRGALIGKIGGFEYAGVFTRNLTDIAKSHREISGLESRYRAKPGAQLAAQLTQTYAREDDREKAVTMLSHVAKLDPSDAKGYLGSATLSVGGMYEQNGQYAQAVPLFHAVLKSGHVPAERAYAHISLAECSLRQNKVDAAIPELKATLAMADCPPNLQQAAQYYLNRIQQFKSKK